MELYQKSWQNLNVLNLFQFCQCLLWYLVKFLLNLFLLNLFARTHLLLLFLDIYDTFTIDPFPLSPWNFCIPPTQHLEKYTRITFSHGLYSKQILRRDMCLANVLPRFWPFVQHCTFYRNLSFRRTRWARGLAYHLAKHRDQHTHVYRVYFIFLIRLYFT